MHFENPRLFCDFFTNNNPMLLLQPVKREVMSLRPRVVLYHDFITDKEVEDVKRLAQPGVSALNLQLKRPMCVQYVRFLPSTLRSSKVFLNPCLLSFVNSERSFSSWNSENMNLKNVCLALAEFTRVCLSLFRSVCCCIVTLMFFYRVC